MYVCPRDLGANVNVLTSAGAGSGQDEAEVDAERGGGGEGDGGAVIDKAEIEEMRSAVKALDTIRKIAAYGIPIAILTYLLTRSE